MATKSLFADIIGTYFPKLDKAVELFNGQRNEPTYLFKDRLRTEFSIDNRWESASVNTSFVMADMVALDSPLPLKKRDTLSVASGKLPKIGVKRQKDETFIQQITELRQKSQSWDNIITKLVADDAACSRSIDEKNEYNFLVGLSTGLVGVAEENGGNKALRINFGYIADHIKGVAKAGALTIADITKTIEAARANGVTLAEMILSLAQFNKLRQTDGAKELVATYRGISYSTSTVLPVPNATALKEAFKDEFGIDITTVDRSVLQERNGVRTSVKPWDDNSVIFTTGGELGALVYGTLAEQTVPVEGVTYQTIDNYKLISRFGENEPLREFTTGQALCLPVIENVDLIYKIDISKKEA